jgi:choline dehydrogenase
VVTEALVHRVRIANGRCTGVDYSRDAELIFAGCSGEVVLTAGAVGSAQLLMLSGVGPRSHLAMFGVEVLADLPGVGANLHDHPVANLVYGAVRPLPPGRHNHAEAVGLLRSDPALDAPDLQFVFVAGQGLIPSAGGPESYTIGVALMLPRSRGTVRLASAEPGAHPVLDPGYYSDDRDLATMVAGLRIAREVGRACALHPWRGAELGPGPGVDDDAGLRAYARRTLVPYMHLVGTCRMGEDDMAVVDTDLRVRGIGGLRVADASVIPAIPSANTNATVYAIAERAAELIGRAGGTR